MSLSQHLCLLACVPLILSACEAGETPARGLQSQWKLRIVDDSSRGADGVRLGDVDKDGRLDIATGWEEGGQIRIAFQPVSAEVRKPWTSVCVGDNKSPEDAVFADVNGDGWLDVVSCCEGKQMSVFFHLNPGNADSARKANEWTTTLLPETKGASRWMYCLPLDSTQLVLGSKEPNGQISIRNLNSSVPLQQIRPAGWIMSLRAFDVDSDGDPDIVYSDRKGKRRCVGWLEQTADGKWKDHLIGGEGMEVMFLDVATIGGQLTVACNTRNGQILLLTPGAKIKEPWNVRRIAHPAGSGAGKAVAVGDLDGDGQVDLACTCGLAAKKHGVYWLKQPANLESHPDGGALEQWSFRAISGMDVGVKFDRIELLDLDQDGDLDLLTCEERDNLGVVWYENPAVGVQD